MIITKTCYRTTITYFTQIGGKKEEKTFTMISVRKPTEQEVLFKIYKANNKQLCEIKEYKTTEVKASLEEETFFAHAKITEK